MQNFITIRLAIPNAVAPILTISTSKDVSRKDVPFGGPENEFHILTPFPPTTQLFGRFWTGLKILAQRALTRGTSSVNSKHPYNNQLRIWKLDVK